MGVCVCVERLNRRKTSFHFLSYIYIYILLSRGHRGREGVGDQRRHLPGARETYRRGYGGAPGRF